MLHPKLSRVMNFVYCHAVLFGLMGTTLRIHSNRRTVRLEEVSWTYLIYSFAIGICLFSSIYSMFPQALLDGYIKYNIVLQWNSFVQIGLQVLAIIGCYGTVWLNRRNIIEFYKDSLIYWRRYGKVEQITVDKGELRELQLSLARMLWQVVLVIYANFLFTSLVQYQLLGVVSQYSVMALGARLSHSLHFVALKLGFHGILILLDRQFGVINLALTTLVKRNSRGKWKSLRSIAAMHLETLQMARRVFRLFDVVNATLFLNMFMGTMTILYHAVQYGNRTIKSNSWGMICGQGLIVFNIWGSLMMMNMLDKVLRSCNNVGHLLKEFSELPKVSRRLKRELDDFSMQIRRNHLVYKVFGVVELNKPAGLRYIGSILTNLILLMQFDLGRKRQPNHKIHYAFGQN